MVLTILLLFFLTSLPAFQASDERKTTTKPTNSTIFNTLKPLSALLNIRPKPHKLSTSSKDSHVNKTMSPVMTPSTEKSLEDKASTPIKVVISEGCIQKESQKDTINATKVLDTELSVKPGSPLVMTHHISLLPGSCTGGCETEMTQLKGRVEFLEKELSALKKKCNRCSDILCPNNCSGQGKCEEGKCVCILGFSGPDCSATSCPSNCTKNGNCVKGKCVCQTGFTGIDCSKGTVKDNIETLSSESSISKPNILTTQTRAEKTSKPVDKRTKTVANTSVDKASFENRINAYNTNTSSSTTVDRTQGKAPTEKLSVQKTELKEPLQSEHKLKTRTKQEYTSHNKLETQNVTQSTEKKINHTLKSLLNSTSGTRPSHDVVKTKLSLSNKTDADKNTKEFQSNTTTVFTEGIAESKVKVEKDKQTNITTSTKKDSHLYKGTVPLKEGLSGNKEVDNHLNITVVHESNKKAKQREEISKIENIEKQANVTYFPQKEKKGITVPGTRNVTISFKKEKVLPMINRTVLLNVESEKKTVEKNANGTTFINKEKHQNNITKPKERTPGKKPVATSDAKDKNFVKDDETTPAEKVKKNSNVTSSTEKDKILHQPSVKISEKITEMKNGLTSSEKEKKLVKVDETTTLKEDKPGQKMAGKYLNATSSSNKIKRIHQSKFNTSDITSVTRSESTFSEKVNKLVKDDGTTALKDSKPGLKAVEKNLNATSSTNKLKVLDQPKVKASERRPGFKNGSTFSEKEKKLVKDETIALAQGKPGQKTVDKHLNVTSSNEKDKMFIQSAVNTLERTSGMRNGSTSRGKKLLHGNETNIHIVTTEKKTAKKLVNITFVIEKEKLHQGNITSVEIKTPAVTHVATVSEKKEKLVKDDETAGLKEGKPGEKRTEKHLNVTSLFEKDKKSHFTNTTSIKGNKTGIRITTISIKKEKRLLEGNKTNIHPGKKTVEQHTHITILKEQDQSSVNDHKEKTSRIESTDTSTEKPHKLVKSNEMPALKDGKPGQKKVEKQTNVTALNEKDKKSHQTSNTAYKRRTSAIGNATTLGEKDILNITTGQKAVEKHVNKTTSIDNNKKQPQSDMNLQEKSTVKTKIKSNVNIKLPSDKDKKNNALRKVTLENKDKVVNTTNFVVKDKKLNQTYMEDKTKNKNTHTPLISNNKHKKQEQVGNVSILKETLGEQKTENSEGMRQKPGIESKSFLNKTKFLDIRAVEVHNITATGFVMTWEAPQGLFRNFTVVRREVLLGGKSKETTENGGKSHGGDKGISTVNEYFSSNRTTKEQTGKADKKSEEKFSQVLAGSVRSYHFRNLRPQTKYSVSLKSSGPQLRSKVHQLIVSTGPESPTELLFSNITETSLSMSWTKPKSTVTGFKVIYTNSENGVIGSMSVDSQLSHVLISNLSAGSVYDISVSSLMGEIESEPSRASIVTVPDSPSNFHAVNVTDSKALLVWKPAKSKVDHYILSVGLTKSPNVTVTVMLSGHSTEHQLKSLQRATLYTVKIMSLLNSLQSGSLSTVFTTMSGVKLQAVTPSKVTWNSALISWKTPRLPFKSYRLTYQLEENKKEVILNPTVSQYELTDLVASTNYTVRVDCESDGQYFQVVSTSFTTAQLPYPYPAECSQVQQNGVKNSGEAEIFPEGKGGEPVLVFCDMETAGGGWTVFQRRCDGTTDFYRGWKDYSKGFGQLSTEFWLGNDFLHTLTNLAPMSLRVDLRSGNETAYAHYSNFTVGSEANHYVLQVFGYSGTAGNSMSYHNNRPFSTKDKDLSPINAHCTKLYMGGWWYKNCYKANLNGLYGTFSQDQGVVWIDWHGKDNSLPFTEMKLRPASLSHMTLTSQG